MSTLILKLDAPLQSWGVTSKYTHRSTERAPSKSGVIGLLAAALGRERDESLTDLSTLVFGVRIEQPGKILSDYQTAKKTSTRGKQVLLPVSHRDYLHDAKFLVAMEGNAEFINHLAYKILHPELALYLGRKSCPPSDGLHPTISNESLDTVLNTSPWRASEKFKNKHKDKPVYLGISRDYDPTITPKSGYTVTVERDHPINFSPQKREYQPRRVIHYTIPAPGHIPVVPEHDPFEEL